MATYDDTLTADAQDADRGQFADPGPAAPSTTSTYLTPPAGRPRLVRGPESAPAGLRRAWWLALTGLRASVEAVRIAGWTVVYGARFAVAGRGRGALEREVRRSAVVRKYLARMGPLYLKVGQVLATQAGMLSPRARDEFRSFFSDLPPMSREALEATLERNLAGDVVQVFGYFEWEPVAVGSVAQVHRARFPDGSTLAVKVVKRGVRERLRASGWAIAALLQVAHTVLPPLRKFDLPAMFGELRPLLTGQGDLLAEAAAQRECAQNFERHPYVRVPRPLDDLCTEDVLVMEFMSGVPGQNPELADFPRDQLAQRFMETFYSAVFLHGFYQVDPHPGNVLFAEEGRLALLDFGLFGRLTEDQRWDLASFYHACVRKEWDVAVQRFTKAFVAQTGRIGDDYDEYEVALAAVLRHHFEDEASRWSTVNFLDDGTRLLRRYQARVSTSFALLAIGLLTGEGFVSRTDPDIDVWETARRFTDRFSPYLSSEVQERFDRVITPAVPRSSALRKEASRYLVAPTHLDRFALPGAYPLIISEGRGCEIRDVDGHWYIDLSCGYGPNILGYGHPAITRAIADTAVRGGINGLGNPDELAFAEQIANAFRPNSKVILSNSGTEAVVMALRLARAATGRDRVAKFEGHHHGFADQGLVSSRFRHRGSRSLPEPVAGSAGVQRAVVDETLVLQLGEPASLERIVEHADELAAVILEPMPATLADYDREFLAKVRAICSRYGIVLVFDEVVTGFRVTYGGVQHLACVTPDLTCLGKVIGGGLPCGAVVGRPGVIDAARTTQDPFLDIESKAFVGGTLSGNSITAAAGLAALRYLEEHPGVYRYLRSASARLRAGLSREAADRGIPCDIRGTYSIFSITFDHASAGLVRDRLSGSNLKADLALSYYMRQHGVYVPEMHTLMLSAAHRPEDLDHVVRAFGHSLDAMRHDGLFAA